jgi:integrase
MSEVNSILASAPINPPSDNRERLSTSRKRKPKKPPKPYPDFPLTAHPTKRWCKKIRGKIYYFGSWNDPDGALKKYLEQKDDLYAGRIPRQEGGFRVRDLANKFLTTKKHRLDNGELSARTFSEYYSACEIIVKAFGRDRLVEDLRPDDFEKLRNHIAGQWGPIRLRNEVQRVRSVFKYAFEAGLIDTPVRCGPGFKGPSKKVLRIHRAQSGSRMFEAHEIRAMLDIAGPALKAMLLLATNCGFGNTDVASLPLSALDLVGEWVTFPRPKTGINRRAKLWPETIQAVQKAIELRPKAKHDADSGLVFLTAYGNRWLTVRTQKQEDGTIKVRCDDSVSKETRKVMAKLRLNGHRSFYALRHSFRTIADESRDQPAVDFVMGHARDDMASVYRERIDDSRLIAVSEHVRHWLFGDTISIQGKAE